MSNNFMESVKVNLDEQKNKEKNYGKVIILSGMSGSGKTAIADILVKKHNYAIINKYVTRPFRKEEIESTYKGENIGIRPVYGLYNDGEKSKEEQEENSKKRKKLFTDKRLPIAYINYENYYGFSIDEINQYIEHGRNTVVIVNDISAIRDLKNLYGEHCISYYIQRENPSNKEIFLELAKKRGDTQESAEKRYIKSIKDFDIYTNNITMYDHLLLNVEDGFEKVESVLGQMDSVYTKQRYEQKKEKQGKAKIYVLMGSPGSGKDEALETIRVQSLLHSIIMPKHTDRERRPEDGEEMICCGDKNYDLEGCDLRYSNYGTNYGVQTDELSARLKDNISSTLIVSNEKALEYLKQKFGEDIVFIYIQGLSKEEYSIQQRDHLQEDYVKRRLQEYDMANEFYYKNWFLFDHTIVNNNNMADLKIQLDNIMALYEQGHSVSIEEYTTYKSKVDAHVNQFTRNKEAEVTEE